MRKRNDLLFDKSPYERKYKRLRLIFILLLLLFFWFIYINFDYMVFKTLITYNYAYTDTLDEIYEQSIGAENVKSYFKNFDAAVIAIVTERLRETAGDRYTYLYTPRQYTVSKENTKAAADEASVSQLSDTTVYIQIPNISKYTREFLNNQKEYLQGYENIVIDLQSNSGGSLNDMYKMASLFLPKGSTIGFEQTRSSFTSSQAKATKKQYFTFENIIILQNSDTASAAEGFTMALKENLDHVTIIGQTSFGKGIGQVTLPIKYGFAIKATVLQTKTPLDNSIHKIGIEPDIIYEEEDIINYAQDYLQKQTAG